MNIKMNNKIHIRKELVGIESFESHLDSPHITTGFLYCIEAGVLNGIKIVGMTRQESTQAAFDEFAFDNNGCNQNYEDGYYVTMSLTTKRLSNVFAALKEFSDDFKQYECSTSGDYKCSLNMIRDKFLELEKKYELTETNPEVLKFEYNWRKVTYNNGKFVKDEFWQEGVDSIC